MLAVKLPKIDCAAFPCMEPLVEHTESASMLRIRILDYISIINTIQLFLQMLMLCITCITLLYIVYITIFDDNILPKYIHHLG